MKNTATSAKMVPATTPFPYNTSILYGKPDASRGRFQGYVRAQIASLSPQLHLTIHHPEIPKVSPVSADDENTEDEQKRIQRVVLRRLGPQEPGGTQKPPVGLPGSLLKTRRVRTGCATSDEADLWAGRVFATSVPDGRNTHSVFYPVPSCILASDARYTPPIFRQQ